MIVVKNKFREPFTNTQFLFQPHNHNSSLSATILISKCPVTLSPFHLPTLISAHDSYLAIQIFPPSMTMREYNIGFITGRGGAGFHSLGPAVARGRGARAANPKKTCPAPGRSAGHAFFGAPEAVTNTKYRQAKSKLSWRTIFRYSSSSFSSLPACPWITVGYHFPMLEPE